MHRSTLRPPGGTVWEGEAPAEPGLRDGERGREDEGESGRGGKREKEQRPVQSTEHSVLSTRLAQGIAEAIGTSHDPHPGPLPEGEGGGSRRMTERQRRRIERGLRV